MPNFFRATCFRGVGGTANATDHERVEVGNVTAGGIAVNGEDHWVLAPCLMWVLVFCGVLITRGWGGGGALLLGIGGP